MTQLHQLIAVSKMVKTGTENTFTAAYHRLQKVDLYNGLVRTYEPLEDGDTRLPGETQIVQTTVAVDITAVQAAVERQIDLCATMDLGNTIAFADIVVGGVTIAPQVPVTTLLWLEKKLVDLRTFIGKIPTLPTDTVWTYDTDGGFYRSTEIKTARSKKTQKHSVIVPPTGPHPAQVAVTTEDTIEGFWTAVKLSGAMPPSRKAQLLAQADELLEAVKYAREVANTVTIEDKRIGNALLNHLFR